MSFKGSHPQVMSRFRVYCILHCPSLCPRIPPWSLKRSLPHLSLHMHAEEIILTFLTLNIISESPHPNMTMVVRNVRTLADRQKQQTCGPLGKSQLPPRKRLISVLAGKRDSSQGGSSIASTIQGQNYTPSSSLNNSRVADIS